MNFSYVFRSVMIVRSSDSSDSSVLSIGMIDSIPLAAVRNEPRTCNNTALMPCISTAYSGLIGFTCCLPARARLFDCLKYLTLCECTCYVVLPACTSLVHEQVPSPVHPEPYTKRKAGNSRGSTEQQKVALRGVMQCIAYLL